MGSARSRTRNVLVATPDPSLRERLRKSLTGLRWQVIEAPGGAEAWAAAEEMPLEALLVDPWLPDLDVTEFLSDFHRQHPQVDLLMTDGVSAPNSPRSPYHQELRYALRRSQDGDTAAWNVAPPMDDAGQWSSLAGLAGQSELPGRGLLPILSEQGSTTTAHTAGAMTSGLSTWSTQAAPMGQTGETGVAVQADRPVLAGQAAGSTLSGTYAARVAEGSSTMAASVTPAQTQPAAATTRMTSASERIPELVGTSQVMLEVSRRIRLVAARSTPVLIEGPTGSGKELVAEALHRLSNRARKPFVAINCAAIPEALLEAELFGHTRGAFTGAVQGRTGRIESADGGTLFLDEIGEMPLALQSKLLRFVESGELQRIGDNETVKVDVRIVAATHQPLAEDARRGDFRADLYYRLAVFLICTPSLSEHMEDLGQLVNHFVERMGRKSPVKRLDASALARLAAHAWPGNVRELEHVLERASILAGDDPWITSGEIDFGLTLMN
jgi:DNA-binding NtrC family response regulator